MLLLRAMIYQSLVDTAQPISQMQCYPCRAVVPCCRPPEKVRNVASGREIDHCTSDMAVHTRKILQSKIGRFSASLGVSLA